LQKVWVNDATCLLCVYMLYLFGVFELYVLRDIHNINDGSPVISRNTWSMYAR